MRGGVKGKRGADGGFIHEAGMGGEKISPFCAVWQRKLRNFETTYSSPVCRHKMSRVLEYYVVTCYLI